MSSEPTGASRSIRRFRQWPRIELDGSLTGVELSSGRTVNFRNVSRGGFQTLSTTPVAPGLLQAFEVHGPDGTQHVIRASVVHCGPVALGSRMFGIGWQAESDPHNLAALAELIDAMTRVPDAQPEPVAARGSRDHG